MARMMRGGQESRLGRECLLASGMASASWRDGVMLDGVQMDGQPAVAGCGVLRQRFSSERRGDAGGVGRQEDGG